MSIGKEDCELLAANTCRNIRLTYIAFQKLPDVPQHLISGLVALAVSDHVGPMNLGNPEEVTILDLAECVQEVVGSETGLAFHDRPVDDPMVRRPDTTLAKQVLGWEAKVELREGLELTLPWFESQAGSG